MSFPKLLGLLVEQVEIWGEEPHFERTWKLYALIPYLALGISFNWLFYSYIFFYNKPML